jgi:cellulose synthase/poly-beta-1,6-N-acetylglucosamine synthase-like glycosyltransferase
MNSIVQQKYDNYHIVFIDDFSTDNNMQGTIDYMNRIGFPKDRITYVQNLKRNYATYNIINAAYNYCGIDDVQMLMDGDD